MVTAIVFSKDRPLQLEAWLESLFHHVGIAPDAVIALVREVGGIRYDALRARWPQVHWISETDFAKDLSEAVRIADPYILWGCDDVVFKGPVDLSLALHRLARDPEAAAFSLRLGRSIAPCPPGLEERDGVLEWDWRRTREPHWNYPWEVSGSIYRKSDVERLLSGTPPARSPNFLEGDLATRLESDPTLLPPRLLSFTETKCLTVTVNRVQETHPNDFDGSASTDVDTLWRLHREGRRMDWRSLEGRANSVIHVDASWFALEAPTTPSRVEVAPTGPLTSILCFVYNRERYVEETIRSVLGQKGAAIELVLLDDGSTDRTPELLRPFLDDPRVRHVRQENVGHDGSFHKLNNRCVELARGDFLSFVGADDVFDPHKTARQLGVFRDDPGLDVLFADGRHIDAAGRTIASDFRRPESVGLTPLNLLRNLFRSNFIAHPTVMMRRSSYLRGGWFENGFAADYHFWLKTALTHRYRYLDEKLLSYRVHAEGSSTGTDNPSHREALKVRGIARGMFGPDDFYPELLVAPDRKAALAEAFLDLGNRSLAVYSDLALAAADYERSLERADSPVTRHNLAMVHLAAGRTLEGRRLLDGVAAGSGDAAEAARNFLSGQGQGKILGLPSDGFLARALPILEQRAMQGRPAPTGAPEPAAFAGGVPCSPRNSHPVAPRLETILARVEALVGRQDLEEASVMLREACSLPGASPELRAMADNLERAAHARRKKASMESVSRVLSEADRILANGDEEGALRVLEAIASEQETLEIVNARAWLHVQAGRLAQAQVEYLKASRLWPDNPDVHANLAGIRLRMGRQEQAESSLRKVLALRPEDAEALLALARLRKSMGDPDEALGLYDNLRRVAPDHEGVVEAMEALARPGSERTLSSEGPEVTIVVPVKDRLPLLTKCLDSLEGTLGDHRVEIVVVDDRSMDDTVHALASLEKAGRIRSARTPVEGSFAERCNAGARIARGNTLVFLDSDIEAQPGWLDALLGILEDPAVGVAGARVLLPDGRVRDAGIAFRPDGNPYHPNRGQDGRSPLVSTRRDMPGLAGAGLAMRTELFASLGGFDTGYRFHVEDLDLCLRVWERGLRVVYEPASCLVQHTDGSTDALPENDRLHGAGLSRLFHSWAEKGGFPPAVQALPGFPALLRSSGTGPTSPTPSASLDRGSPGARTTSTMASLSGVLSSDPKVSVIVPTCDRPVFLQRALESLKTQTWRDFEVVVVDDAGCDVSGIVEEFLQEGLPIRLVVQPERRGLGAARNAGIAASRAPWIAYLDDDDLYYPDHLRLLLETLERTGAKVAYSDSMRAVEEEQDGRWVVLSNELAMSNEFDREGFLRSNLTPVNNVIHARSCWQEVGGIDESLPVLEDWDFWIRLSRRWGFVHVPVATTEIRWRSNGANMTFQRQNQFQPTRDRIASKVAAMLKAEQTGRVGVSIVIPVHGNLELTKQCLDAVRSTTDAVTTEIVVVDDASPDDSAAWLREEEAMGLLKAVILPVNKGFAGACNAGAGASSGRTILFLNNDTIVQPGWLDAMLAGLEDPTVGLVGSRLLYPEGDIQHAGIRMMADGKVEHEFRYAAGNDPRVVESRDRAFVTGACIALRREVFTKIGGFDEGYHMYVEDLDLCLKVWDSGLRVRYVAESVVVHLESRTVSDPARRAELVESGLARLRERWMGCWPEALLGLPDWPSHFRRGASIRWCAPMLHDGPDADVHRRIVEFLEPLLPSMQADPGRHGSSSMAAVGQDPGQAVLWTRVLERPHAEAVRVFDAGSADAWDDAGRPSGHVVFARSLEAESDRRFADFLQSAAIVLACGPEVASACGERGIRGELIELPTLEDGMFPDALLGACARLMEGASRMDSGEATPVLHWMAPTLNYSGYARLNREAFLAFSPSSAKGISHDSLSASPAFLDDSKDADEIETARWSRAMQAAPDASGLCLISVPACDFARVRAMRPKFARYAGLTMFETDQLPTSWKDGCLEMDEIWVPSTFNLETFATSGVPEGILHRIPCGIDMDRFRPGVAKPLALASRRKTNFLSVFEWSPRKGWDVLLGAWARAFDRSDDVSLTIKSYIAHSQPGEIQRRIDAWYRANGIDPTSVAPIDVVDAFLTDRDMPSLYAAADVFVLPTRGEGWGLPYLEAMASGIPVIATRWSAHLDFVTDANGYLVDHRLVRVGEAQTAHSAYYEADHRWADPSLDHLVELLRHCARNPDEVRGRGLRARRDVESEWSSRRTAAWIAGRSAPRPVAVATPSRAPFSPVVAGHDLPSVAWCGPLFNFSGYARQSREAVTALVNLGASVSVDPQQNDLKWFEGLRGDAEAMAHWKRVLSVPARGDVLVCCDLPSDARGAHDVFAEMATGHPDSRARVAWTMFETDRAPVGWAEKLNRMDQVWVPSRQVHAAFLASGVDSSRLRIVPDGLDPVAYANPRPYALPGPAKGTTFLSVFQWSRRKGYDVLLSAWAQAFRPSDDVRLVLRCHGAGGVSARSQLEAWLSRSGLSLERMAPVILIEDFIPEPEMPGLYAACDVFVLPTRGEGWGLPFLEAMASGKPSIATAWGGQTDFLHEGVAWMLPATALVPVDAVALQENPFLTPDHRWADPQVADLVSALRAANGSADERRRKGRMARGEFLARWTSAHTGQTIAAALRDLRDPNPGLQPQGGGIGSSRLSGVLASIASGLRRDPGGLAARQVADRAPSGSSSSTPKVSVILPTRDRPVFLRRALESLETQTFRDFEVVVVDDAGCDVSAIAAEFSRRGLSLRLEVHPERRGLGAARNTGIRAARAPWIAYLDDDDLYYPDHLRLILDALDRTGAKVAYSDSMRAVEEERDGAWVVLSNELAMSNDFDRDAFLRTNLTPVNNVVHARSCWELVGGIDESLPVLEDWDFWIRLSRRWDFVHVPVATTEIRWRSNGANMTFQRQRDFQPTRDRIAAKVAEMLRLEVLEREGVSMVILVRDCLDVTKACLASLEVHTPEPHEVILVDNGSNAETTAWLRDWVATRPRSVLIRNDDNRGFAGGNNQGLALAKGRYLLLLNNDTVLTPGWLARMLAVLSRHPECGAVGPVSNRISGPQLDTTATYADTDGLVRHAQDRAVRFQGRSDEILRAVGFCLLFRREVFDAVGGLDECFGKGNFEDDDFSLRVRHAGWSSRMALDSFVHHVGGATFRGQNIDYAKSLLTNWAIFLRKWGLPEDLPYEKGYPFQQSPPRSALVRIETPTPLRDHELVESRVYWPVRNAEPTREEPRTETVVPAKAAMAPPSVPGRNDMESLSSILFQVESAVAMQDSLQADALSREAVELHPEHPLAWLSRAMVLRGAGKSGKALEALTKSASLGGGAEVVYETMALHLQEGRNAPALVQWNLLRANHPQWVKERKAMHQSQGLPWLPDRFAKPGKSPKKPAGKKR